MTFNRNLLSEAVRYGLAAGAVGLFAAAPAFAQDQTQTTDQATTTDQNAQTLDRITVTGSRIPRVQVEGPNPVTVIKREDLQVTGDLSVADVLRSTTFNSFGSIQQASGNTAQSQATINLRGLGSQYTLILLDGRRMAGSPVFGAAIQNLNSIPFAAVERIEILRDGASAIYGSDAVGGVVNVILRKDYEGLAISLGAERPTKGEPNANSGSITGGVSGDRGNLTFVIDHQDRAIFFNHDRPTGIPGLDPAVGLSAFGYPGTAYLYDSTDGTRSGGFLGSFADPRCPTALGSDPLFPNSVLTNTPYGTACYFNFSAVAANEASLKRDSLMVNGNFELTDNITAFTRVTSNSGSSFGRYAPTPITGPFPSIAGDNPNNVFGQDATLLLRFVPGGNRDDTVRDHMLDILFGLQGQNDWFGGSNWEVAAHHNNYRIDRVGNGYLNRNALQPLIDNGTFNPFGDPNSPGNVIAIARAKHTIMQNSSTRFFGVDGNIGFDLFQMANGPVSFVTGFEYRDEQFQDLVDAASAAGQIAGTSGGNSAGERAAYAVYAEGTIPLLSTLNIDLAGRFDHYNDFGDSFNPRISLEFRPIESLLLRGSWGTGFRAPSLSQLYASPAQSFNNATDRRACDIRNGVDTTDTLNIANLPFNPCTSRQYENRTGGNPNLGAEESTSWNAGVVWNPIDRLTLSLDYFNIDLKDQVSTVGLQNILNIENANNGDPRVTRNPSTGAIILINDANANVAGRKEDGYDFEAEYSFDTAYGTFTQDFSVSYINKFEVDSGAGGGFTDFIDYYLVPQYRSNLRLGWKNADFGATLIGNLIGPNGKEDPSFDGDQTDEDRTFPNWVTWDIQGTYNTPWNGTVTVGVRNMFDKDPPLTNDVLASPFYANSLYNWLGRVPYVKYEQRF